MNRIQLFILLFMTSLSCIGGEGRERVLPRFECLTERNGLSNNEVLHILQLHDGRMVVTTDGCINLYDEKEFLQFPCMAHEVAKIPNYHGAYHVYADRKNRLWVKEWGNVWCMDLNTGTFVDLQSMQPMTDVFIDSAHDLWIVADTTVRTPEGQMFCTRVEWGNLQDLDADSVCLYLFYSTGMVACYNRQNQKLLYTSQPTALAPYVQREDSSKVAPYEDYEKTSLVVRASNGIFFQLRGGKRYIFLRFDPETREWGTVFETSTGAFHSLCVPSDDLALIGCPTGVWSIGLQTGEMVLHSFIETHEGEVWQTGVNSVVCDKQGGLWLGTSWKGVMHADTIYALQSYTLYYIAAALGGVLLLVLCFFHRYATRQQRKEQQLMLRIQELVGESISFREEADKAHGENSYLQEAVEKSSGEAGETQNETDGFILRAISLVEQNLHTPGYTVERLAADLCMERTGLYRKLNALVNQSPTLFMRSIRMKSAAQMLQEGTLTVSEIAERTGFSSVSYFSRLFQETYGCKPSEYGRK